MRLAKALLIAILVLGALGCGNKSDKKEPQEPVTNLEIEK